MTDFTEVFVAIEVYKTTREKLEKVVNGVRTWK